MRRSSIILAVSSAVVSSITVTTGYAMISRTVISSDMTNLSLGNRDVEVCL